MNLTTTSTLQIQLMKSNEPDQLNPKRSDDEMLDALQRETFTYFIKEVNIIIGLIADKT